MIETYQQQMMNPSLQNDDSSNESYKYVIITSNELEEHFTNFVAYKNNYISTRTINLSYIKNQLQSSFEITKIRRLDLIKEK